MLDLFANATLSDHAQAALMAACPALAALMIAIIRRAARRIRQQSARS